MKNKIIKIMVALLLVLSCIGVSVLTVSAAAPTNQNQVLNANKYVKDGAKVTVNSTGDYSQTIWLAPLGTTIFVDGNTITESNGTTTFIYAPVNDGVYRLYVENAASEFSAASTHLVTVDSTPPTISVSSPSLNSTGSTPVTYTVTYADTNFYLSSLSAGNIILNKTGTAQCSKTVSGNGLTRTVTLSNITGNGTIGISIAAHTGSDWAGNFCESASGNSFTVINSIPAPTNEDIVFPSNVSTGNTNPVGIASAGDPTYTVWFAPYGTTVFAEGQTMTKAGGTDTSIYAPSQDGVYKLYVLDSSGKASVASLATLTDETAPLITISADTTDLVALGQVYYTVTYSDTNFYLSSLSSGNILINATGTVTFFGASVAGNGNTRMVQVSGISGNGTIGITIAKWTGSDFAGNLANGASSEVDNVNR